MEREKKYGVQKRGRGEQDSVLRAWWKGEEEDEEGSDVGGGGEEEEEKGDEIHGGGDESEDEGEVLARRIERRAEEMQERDGARDDEGERLSDFEAGMEDDDEEEEEGRGFKKWGGSQPGSGEKRKRWWEGEEEEEGEDEGERGAGKWTPLKVMRGSKVRGAVMGRVVVRGVSGSGSMREGGIPRSTVHCGTGAGRCSSA